MNIDVDEFLILKGPETLNQLMEDYSDAACLVIPWRMFGSSGHDAPQPTGVLQSFTACNALNPLRFTPGKAISVIDNVELYPDDGKNEYVHRCIPKPGKQMITPQGKEVKVRFTKSRQANLALMPMSDFKVELYHYRVKSWLEFYWKMQKGKAIVYSESSIA